jgi:hypothetical protein
MVSQDASCKTMSTSLHRSVLRQCQAWSWSKNAPVSMVTRYGLSYMQPSAIRLSSLPLDNTFSVRRVIVGHDACFPFFTPALTSFPSLGRLLL